eukprot:c29309_g1_i4 orf=644-2545(-)
MGNCLPVSTSFSSNSSASFPHSFIRTPESSNLMAIRKRRPSDAFWDSSKRTRALQMEVAAVLTTPTDDIGQHYDMGKELGSGQFGVIRQCTDKQTGESFACKSIAKARLTSRQDVEDVRNEIEIMSHLSGHSNIVQLIDVFEDTAYVHIVMELCLGGELFDRIVQRKSYPESEAALLIKSLVEVVKHCHDRGVIHRDLKPENILLATTSPSSPIKLADFGLALRFAPGKKFSGMAGSAYYIAPEILNGNYSEEVDMWSVGVILYILLSGVPPFWGETEQRIFEAINEARIDFLCDPWWRISDAAKDLIRGLLCVDAATRLKPDQVLMHPWIVRHTSQPAHSQGNGMMGSQSLEARTRASKAEELIGGVALPDSDTNRECDMELPQEVAPTLKDAWMPGASFSALSFVTTASGDLAPMSPGHLQTRACSMFDHGLSVATEDSSVTFEVVADNNMSDSPVPDSQNFDIQPPTNHFAFPLSSPSSLSRSITPPLFRSEQESETSLVLAATKNHLDNSSPPSTSFSTHSPSRVGFDRWPSFSQVVESTFANILVTLMEDGCTHGGLKASKGNDAVVVDSRNGKLLGVHDKDRSYCWEVFGVSDATVVVDPSMPCSSRCWTPCSAIPTLPFSAEFLVF